MSLADKVRKELESDKKCSIFDNLSALDQKYLKALEEKFYGVLADNILLNNGMSEDELLVISRYSKDRDLYNAICTSNTCPKTPLTIIYERSKRKIGDTLSTIHSSHRENDKHSSFYGEEITITNYEVLEYIAFNPNTSENIINEIALDEFKDGDFSLNLKAAKNPKCKLSTLAVLRDLIENEYMEDPEDIILEEQLDKIKYILESRGHDKNIKVTTAAPGQLYLPGLSPEECN